MSKRILFISNGHGEDNHSSYIVRTLQEQRPDLEIAAMPLVGEGRAYRSLGIPIIGPTQVMPSGGFFYMNPLHLFKDLQAGLLSLTARQLRAVLNYAPSCNLIVATGDVVSQSFAYLTGLPFISFISCLSSLYEGKLNLGLILWNILQSSRCQTVFTRDIYTAKDLQQQGLTKAQFGGIPSLDRLIPTGKDLELSPGQPLVALLPGSRPEEAIRNFKLQLDLVSEIAKLPGGEKLNFRAALVPGVMNQLEAIATSTAWQHQNGKLTKEQAKVIAYADAFNDIICNCDLVIGMAGLAVDQAVAIGKAIIQIPGKGPQFTYQFAEAQTRLLGVSVQTIGTEAATAETIKVAALRVLKTLADAEYLVKCRENGLERFGRQGASLRITQAINAII